MRLLIRMPLCTHLFKLQPTHPKMLRLEQRLSVSAARRRTEIRSSVHPTSRPSLPVPVCSPHRGLSVLCTSTGRALTLSRTPVAFASSSATSTPAPAEPPETQRGTERDQTPATVPVEDVRRIFRLAHPERWRLAGKSQELFTSFHSNYKIYQYTHLNVYF